jgi:broad specificity phosphatase PhoE
MSTRVLVIRHGETEWSRARRFAGSRDIALSEAGRRQCEALADALAGVPVAAVYASPLERARITAETIAKPHRLPVTVEADLREMAFGPWEGLTREEVARREPDRYGVWASSPHELVLAGAERLTDVAARVAPVVDELRNRHAGETIVLVAHAVVVRLIVLGALGLGADRLWAVDASPAGITEIEYQPAWVTVHRMNTLAHLVAP